jgi:hypothetical protein
MSNASNAVAAANAATEAAKKLPWDVKLFGVIAAALCGGSFYLFSRALGSSDNWVHIQSQFQTVLVVSLIGTITLMAAALSYFIQDPTKTMYFVVIVSIISLGLSYGALATAAISR